jgi:type IX secretion system PorP/SprF family membrane protein
MKTIYFKINDYLIIPMIMLFCLVFRIGMDSRLLAQQVQFNSQYYTNQFIINPAYTGNKTYSNAFMSHRSQWVNVKGAPQQSYLSIDAPVKEKNIGLGFKAFTYSTDIISQTGMFMTYSYSLKVKENQDLHFGLAMGVLDNKIDYARAVMRDKDDPFFLQQQQNKAVFSADLGIVYNWKKLEIGIAIPQLLGNNIKYGTDAGYIRHFDLARHYQTTLKYVFTVNEEKEVTAYPLLMIRTVKGAPLQYDINAVVDWKKMAWAGLTYHSSYALAVSAGVRYKNFSLGYAYDVGMSKIKTYTGTSSEFILGYIFSKKQTVFVDSTKSEVWAEQIQSSAAMIQPADYDDEYWNSLNKGVDKQVIFNTIIDAVLSGKLQAYDIVTGTPLSVSKVKSSLVRLGDTPKLITKNDISKIRMNERWLFDRKSFKLTKQVTRVDLLITQVNDAGEITGNDKPLFFVKMKN